MELFYTSKFDRKFKLASLSNVFKRSWKPFPGRHLPPDFCYKNEASICLLLHEQQVRFRETFSHPDTEAALSSNFWWLSLFSVDMCCLLFIIPPIASSAQHYPLILISITYFSLLFLFPFSSIFHRLTCPSWLSSHSVIFCELRQLAIGNLSFSLMKKVGRNSCVNFLLCRHFHGLRDGGEVSFSQRFRLYLHFKSEAIQRWGVLVVSI